MGDLIGSGDEVGGKENGEVPHEMRSCERSNWIIRFFTIAPMV
jgi:hypothetical protein